MKHQILLLILVLGSALLASANAMKVEDPLGFGEFIIGHNAGPFKLTDCHTPTNDHKCLEKDYPVLKTEEKPHATYYSCCKN